MLEDRYNKAKGYYSNAVEKQELANYCCEKGKYKQMVVLDYYCIFNLCRIIYSIEYTDTSSHKSLLGNFNKIYVHEKKLFDKTLGSFISTLEKQRGLCDYEANYPIDKDFALYLHEQTQIIADILISYIMKNYEAIFVYDNKNITEYEEDKEV